MKDLKIRVDNDAESKEAQELFFELGYTWSGDSKDIFDFDMPEYIVNWNNGYITVGDDFDKNRQEITLPELRDLVVLKRNSIDDATHEEDKNDPEFKYRLIDNHWYVITEGNPVWRKDSIDLNEAPLFIKPIEKPMKEYLIKSGDGKYLLTHHDSIWVIEIPEGATYYAKDASLGKSGNFFFRLRSDDFDFEAVWLESNWIQAIFNVENQDVLWQRNNNQTIASAVESSHPEELPFIDDEPSINDQYAEIEKVRQTLKTRQDQYGSFEDVAMLTEQMVDVMRKGYYEKLAYNQKMALYMICSKMARIVNGNPNHKDSWHDIAGYATLIDNELESEKDMPF